MGVQKGEMVVLIGAPVKAQATEGDVRAALERALATMSVKDAAAFVSESLGVPRRTVYDMALEIRNATR